MMWDPVQYQRYADERSRPFYDLTAQINAMDPAYVVDLGCGPGTLTATLTERWPGAAVEGVDSSPAMIADARAREAPGKLDFTLADVREWQPSRPVDVLVSNAMFQWVPGHADLLPWLTGALAPGGWLAFQVPGNHDSPSHQLLYELRESQRWRDRLAGVTDRGIPIEEPAEYLRRLTDLACSVDVWETTYHHVLHGENPVLEWMKGTGARPVLDVLNEPEREEFLGVYGRELRAAYPPQEFGTLFPFRRVFVVAHKTLKTASDAT